MRPLIKFTYFNIEAAGEPVRLALLLSKTPFEDIRVDFGEEWNALKPTLPNGQLPVMTIDDGPIRTQSKAMLRWVGDNLSETLYPRDKLFDIEEAIGLVEDLQRDFYPAQMLGGRAVKYGHPADFASTEEGKQKIRELREQFMSENFPSFMTRLCNMITAHGGKFLVRGEDPTIADCIAVPLLRGFTRGFIDHVDPKCLDGYPVIVKYIKDFCALEPIQGRYTSGIH
jgi:glutathione S-transferase